MRRAKKAFLSSYKEIHGLAFFHPTYHDKFSNWFTIRELIINTVKIIEIANHFGNFCILAAGEWL